MISADELWPKLETLGEVEVRKRLAQDVYGQQKRPLVEAWLATKDSEHTEAAAQRHEIRENKALQLSAEANSIARGSKTVAVIAVTVSALALLVAIVAVVIQFWK